MRITSLVYEADLADPSSSKFAQIASQVEGELGPVILAGVQDAVGIKVYGFLNGSVVAMFNVIMNSTAAKPDTESLATMIKSAITNGNFTTISVDTTYNFTVTGDLCLLYNSYHFDVSKYRISLTPLSK